MAESNNWIIFDGDLCPTEQPVASATSRGLMYGEGVFETLRIYKGQTLLFTKHFERLRKGLQVLNMAGQQILEIDQLRKLLTKLLLKKELFDIDAIVRIQFWQDGERGYRPQATGKIHYTISGALCPSYENRHPTLATIDTRRIPSKSQPTIGKFTNGINYILASQEAAKKGADDALMQTIDGWISETTIANLFWIKDDRIYTPSLTCDVLPGITRQAIINIIEDHQQLTLHEGEYHLEQLYEAEAVGMCNSVRELLSVEQVDKKVYEKDHPVLKELQGLYSSFRDQKLEALPKVE